MHLWNPLAPENIANPYPMYATLRREAPIYKAQTGEWIITRYNDVKAILKNKQLLSGSKKQWVAKGITYFQNKNQDLSQIARAIDSFLLFLNPPAHTKIRKLVSTAWSNKKVDNIIKDNIRLLLSGLNGTVDIIDKLAQPLPAMTIAGIMGIPLKDYEILRSKGTSLLKVLDLYISLKELVLVDKSAHFFIEYFSRLLSNKRKKLSDDLTSAIIKKNQELSSPANDRELISLLIFLFLAGEETTVSLIGNGLMNLDQWPDQKKMIMHNSSIMPAAIEELLRYDSPVHMVGRIANDDLIFHNVKIKKNDILTLCLASANRDNSIFNEAEVLDLERANKRHLAFGTGIHVCMGDWLAKRQGELAISAFLERFPNYKTKNETLTWNNNLSIRSLKSLEVKL